MEQAAVLVMAMALSVIGKENQTLPCGIRQELVVPETSEWEARGAGKCPRTEAVMTGAVPVWTAAVPVWRAAVSVWTAVVPVWAAAVPVWTAAVPVWRAVVPVWTAAVPVWTAAVEQWWWTA